MDMTFRFARIRGNANGYTVRNDTESPDMSTNGTDLIQAIREDHQQIKSLLETVPRHRALLLTACEGYTQYAYGFVQLEAERIEPTNYDEAMRLQGRALALITTSSRYKSHSR